MARDAVRRPLLPALLAATLLLTQVAGLAHALSHYNADAPTKERVTHASLCAKCANFHKLGAAVPPSRLPETGSLVFLAPSIPAAAATPGRVTASFLARAPPAFV